LCPILPKNLTPWLPAFPLSACGEEGMYKIAGYVPVLPLSAGGEGIRG